MQANFKYSPPSSLRLATPPFFLRKIGGHIYRSPLSKGEIKQKADIMNFEDIILHKDNSIKAKTLRAFLIPFSWLYIFVHFLFFIPYKLGIRKKHKAHIPVICVGNITMGGTGKTPFVITLSNILKDFGYKPVIISRGYGRKSTENMVFCPKDSLLAEDTGDEPYLLSKATDLSIIIGKNRIKSIQMSQDLDCNIIILDDGMQYWQLHKDIEIAIASAQKPFGTGRVIPAGDLREPKKGLKRCQFIVLTDNNPIGKETIEKVQDYCQNSFVHEGITKPLNITYKEKNYDLDFLKGKKVIGICGIGNPERFKRTLSDLGADTLEFITYPDHHNYMEEDINLSKEKAKECDFVVTTAKDRVKMPLDLNVAVVNIYTQIDEDFKEKLKIKLKENLITK